MISQLSLIAQALSITTHLPLSLPVKGEHTFAIIVSCSVSSVLYLSITPNMLTSHIEAIKDKVYKDILCLLVTFSNRSVHINTAITFP